MRRRLRQDVLEPHKTRMEGFRAPTKLTDERLGHMDGSVQARYTHITREMRQDLLVNLTAEWEASLDARLAMSATSPVWVRDGLLRERLRARSQSPFGGEIPKSSFGDTGLSTHPSDEGGGDGGQGGVCGDEERFDSGQFVVHAGHRHFVVQVVNVADSADHYVDSGSAAVVDQQAAGVGVDRDVAQVSCCRAEPVGEL